MSQQRVALLIRKNGDRVTYVFDSPWSYIDVDNKVFKIEQQDARVIYNNEEHQMCKIYDVEMTQHIFINTSVLWRYISSEGSYVSGYIYFAVA